jgi:hypothetical protein
MSDSKQKRIVKTSDSDLFDDFMNKWLQTRYDISAFFEELHCGDKAVYYMEDSGPVHAGINKRRRKVSRGFRSIAARNYRVF